ncbi:meiotic recombination, partial [Coemansia spiralis]
MAAEDDADTLRVLVATDNHLGYLERDPIRGQDSFAAFGEILQLARERNVDMVLLGGDLFHDNRPSRRCLHQTLVALRKSCMGDRPVALEYLSDPAVDFGAQFPTVNYEDPNLNIALPVFSIHGNHDDPSGDGNLSVLDVLGTSGLVNYFGRQAEVDNIRVSPVLLRKGRTHLALYGLGNVRDERLHRTMARKHMTMCQPAEDTGQWFNLMVLHQNRVAHGPKNHIPEHFLSSFLDLVVWGHEHQCQVDPEYNHQKTFYVSQPGSSVATALSSGEAEAKHVAVLRIHRRNFRLEKVRLKNVRPFVIEDVVLAAVTTLSPQSTEGEIVEYLRQRVEAMIARAQREYQEQLERGDAHIAPALGPQPKPLVRVRVEYSGGFESFHPQRFGLLFSDRVANPRDIVYFYRKPRAPSQDSQRTGSMVTQETQESSRASVPVPVEAMHVENLISEFLDDSSMHMLVDLELAEAIRLFVQKGDNDAIAQSLKTTVADTQKRILAETTSEITESSLAAEISRTRSQRRQAAQVAGHGAIAANDDDDDDDDRGVGAVTLTAKRTAVNQADRKAIKAFEQVATTAVASIAAGRDSDHSSGSGSGSDSDNDEFRAAGEDLAGGAKRGRAAPKKTATRPPAPPTSAGTSAKRSRATRARVSAAETVPETDGDSGGSSDDSFAGPAKRTATAVSRPSRNARSTLTSGSSSGASSPELPSQDSGSYVAETPVATRRRAPTVDSPEAAEDNTIPSSVTKPRGRGRGRGRGAQRTAAAAAPRAAQKKLNFSQRSSSTSSQAPVAVEIKDDSDDDDDSGFGRFSLRKRASNMASLVAAIGVCLERLDEGSYGESLAAIDQYLGSDAVAAPAPPEWDDSTDETGSNAGSEGSSFSDVASFRDAPSSPLWLSGAPLEGPGSHTAAGVLGSLRQVVLREESWHRTKAAYEDHLAQMAVHLQQQTIALDAAHEKLAELGHAAPDAPPAADEDSGRPAPVSNWWSTFLPVGMPAGAVASLTGPPNWSPLAMDFSTVASGDPAYLAPPTPLVGGVRYPPLNPAYTTVPATGEVVCIECIQACERVADAVLSGNFDARVRCTRCHAADDAEGDEWPLLGGSSAAAAVARTPLIRRPIGHTQRLAN